MNLFCEEVHKLADTWTPTFDLSNHEKVSARNDYAGKPLKKVVEEIVERKDEMSDITWIQAFQMLLQMFRTMLTENTELSDEKISELVDALLKTQLQAA